MNRCALPEIGTVIAQAARLLQRRSRFQTSPWCTPSCSVPPPGQCVMWPPMRAMMTTERGFVAVEDVEAIP